MSYKIYSYPDNVRVWKSLIVASYCGMNIETPPFSLDQRDQKFYSKFPPGKVPGMDTPEGPLFESDAIMKYVARKGRVLYGNTPYESSLIDAWMDWCNFNIVPNVTTWFLHFVGIRESDASTLENAKESIKISLDTLNKHLLTHTYVSSENITIADISMACTLWHLFGKLCDNKFRAPFPNVIRWFNTVVAQKNFVSVSGNFVYSTVEANPAPKVVEKKSVAKDSNSSEPKKLTNPLDLLPPSKMDLEEWKRFYSNNKIGDSMEWLWERFDDKEWSFWFADYNHNSENKRLFMTSNLAGGFVQRLEVIRKWAFAVINIFGDEKSGIELAGCFMVRGTELPPELTTGKVNVNGEHVDDADSYTWRKADVNSPCDKKLISDFFGKSGEFNGKYGGKAVSDSKVLH